MPIKCASLGRHLNDCGSATLTCRDPILISSGPCRARAGLCMSQDGKNWARLEAEHHTAAVLDAGDAGEWDAAFIGSPQVGSRPPNQSHARGLIIALLLPLHSPMVEGGLCRQGRQKAAKGCLLHRTGLRD